MAGKRWHGIRAFVFFVQSLLKEYPVKSLAYRAGTCWGNSLYLLKIIQRLISIGESGHLLLNA